MPAAGTWSWSEVDGKAEVGNQKSWNDLQSPWAEVGAPHDVLGEANHADEIVTSLRVGDMGEAKAKLFVDCAGSEEIESEIEIRSEEHTSELQSR